MERAPWAAWGSALIANGAPGGSQLFVVSPSVRHHLSALVNVQNQYATDGPGGPIVTDDANDILSVDSELYFTDATDGVGQIGGVQPG